MKTKLLIIIVSLFFAYNSLSAQNLVPDSSFEIYESCANNLDQFDLLIE